MVRGKKNLNDPCWYIFDVNDRHHRGPFQYSKLAEMYSQGSIIKSTPIWFEGLSTWSSLEEVLPEITQNSKGLQELLFYYFSLLIIGVFLFVGGFLLFLGFSHLNWDSLIEIKADSITQSSEKNDKPIHTKVDLPLPEIIPFEKKSPLLSSWKEDEWQTLQTYSFLVGKMKEIFLDEWEVYSKSGVVPYEQRKNFSRRYAEEVGVILGGLTWDNFQNDSASLVEFGKKIGLLGAHMAQDWPKLSTMTAIEREEFKNHYLKEITALENFLLENTKSP
jgi:hypothetical protein